MAVSTAEAQTPGKSGVDLTALSFLLNPVWGEMDMWMLDYSLVGVLDPDTNSTSQVAALPVALSAETSPTGCATVCGTSRLRTMLTGIVGGGCRGLRLSPHPDSR
jgi:hypothetical protein